MDGVSAMAYTGSINGQRQLLKLTTTMTAQRPRLLLRASRSQAAIIKVHTSLNGSRSRSMRDVHTKAAVRQLWRARKSGPLPSSLDAPPHHFKPDSILPLVSSAVEGAAELATFEAIAGRSAMVGFFAAVALEWGTQESTFKLFAPEQTALLAAAVVASIAIAAALAASAAYPRAQAASAARASGSDGDGAEGGVQAQARAWWWLGARIHEAVMSSLTGNQGSASGITQLRVDEVVDFVVDRCLTRKVDPVFDPLYDAGSTVVTVMDSFILAGEDRADLPQ